MRFIVRQRGANFKAVSDQGFTGVHAGQDRMRERIEQERDLATQKARLTDAPATLALSQNSIAVDGKPHPQQHA